MSDGDLVETGARALHRAFAKATFVSRREETEDDAFARRWAAMPDGVRQKFRSEAEAVLRATGCIR